VTEKSVYLSDRSADVALCADAPASSAKSVLNVDFPEHGALESLQESLATAPARHAKMSATLRAIVPVARVGQRIISKRQSSRMVNVCVFYGHQDVTGIIRP